MRLSEKKIEVTQAILNSNSPAMLKQMEAVIEAYKTDLWDELSTRHKQSVENARKQLKEGKGVTHKTVMKKYKKWLSK